MSDPDFLVVLVEEVGEVARVLSEHANGILVRYGPKLREELVQVAAVCVARIEAIDAGVTVEETPARLATPDELGHETAAREIAEAWRIADEAAIGLGEIGGDD